MNKRVVVTGMGVVSPNGIGLIEFLPNIRNAINGIKYIKELELYGLGCLVGGIPDISKCEDFFTSYKLYYLSYSTKYSILACEEAIQNSNLQYTIHQGKEPDYNTGIILGTLAGQPDFLGMLMHYVDKKMNKKIRTFIAEQMMISGSTALISGLYGFGNYCSATSMACASSADTIVQGFDRIKQGKAKRMLVGGYDSYSPYMWTNFDILRIISREHNDSPEKASRPMSSSPNGFVPSSGAGVLIIEDLETALTRNAPIYAEIIGANSNCGGQRQGGTMSAPNIYASRKCLKDCIEQSGIKNSDIDYISGHLTSTMADVLEIQNWNNVLGRRGKDFPYINSLKSIIGHTIGAAGAIETIAGILQMNNSFIHASLNCEKLHPEIEKIADRSRIPLKRVENVEINCFAKSSFGFGDVNSCLIIKKYKS